MALLGLEHQHSEARATSGPLSRLLCPPERSLPPLQASVSPNCNSDQINGWKTSLTAVFTCMSLMPGEAERRFMFHDHMYAAPSVHLLSGYFLSTTKHLYYHLSHIFAPSLWSFIVQKRNFNLVYLSFIKFQSFQKLKLINIFTFALHG